MDGHKIILGHFGKGRAQAKKALRAISPSDCLAIASKKLSKENLNCIEFHTDGQLTAANVGSRRPDLPALLGRRAERSPPRICTGGKKELERFRMIKSWPFSHCGSLSGPAAKKYR